MWDHPRPPALEREPARVRIEHRGVVVVDSAAAWRVLETSHPPVYYVPADEVQAGALRPTDRSSWCEFKGLARYWDVLVGDEVLPGVAWGYPRPSAGYEPLAGRVAFYAGPFERCTVAGERALPQPGGFYGGWVTSRYVGPFKGEAGSTGW